MAFDREDKKFEAKARRSQRRSQLSLSYLFGKKDELRSQLLPHIISGKRVAYRLPSSDQSALIVIEGVAIGRLFAEDRDTEDFFISIFASHVASTNEAGEEFLVDASYEGVPIRVITTGEFRAASQTLVRPAVGGVSIGCINGTTGSLGCLVESTSTNNGNARQFILSCNHVLTNNGYAPIGTPIIQPGPLHGGTNTSQTIAYLAHAHPVLKGGPFNDCDCAIAEVLPTMVASGISGGITISAGPLPDPQYLFDNDVFVKKCGQTTGLTRGLITDIDGTVKIHYPDGTFAMFDGQLLIRSGEEGGFSADGDSGALVLTDTGNEPVGLLAGVTANGYSVANPIGAVLAHLGVRIV